MKLKHTLLFWIALAGLVIIFLPGYTKLQELKDKNRNLQQKIERLDKENSLLLSDLKRVENDSFYQEKIAREKLGVVRKNEIPVKVIPGNKE